MIRVSVLSGSLAMRVGLEEILGGDAGLSVLRAARDEAGDRQTGSAADVLLLASMPGMDWHTLAPEAAVLLLTDQVDEARLLSAARSQAWGVLPLDASEEEILAAVHALGEGLWVGAPVFVHALLKRPAMVELAGAEVVVEAVTRRELDVLQSIARGLSNKQIALALGISEHTVKFHLSSLYAKLGATNRTEAVRIGTQQGLIVL